MPLEKDEKVKLPSLGERNYTQDARTGYIWDGCPRLPRRLQNALFRLPDNHRTKQMETQVSDLQESDTVTLTGGHNAAGHPDTVVTTGMATRAGDFVNSTAEVRIQIPPHHSHTPAHKAPLAWASDGRVAGAPEHFSAQRRSADNRRGSWLMVHSIMTYGARPRRKKQVIHTKVSMPLE